jgi:hypothetical protein
VSVASTMIRNGFKRPRKRRWKDFKKKFVLPGRRPIQNPVCSSFSLRAGF